jgi:SAM-dependent methyltransferase
LDVGCGSGSGSLILAEAGATEVVGVDPTSPPPVAAADGYSIRFLRSDVLDMPVADGSFDLVVAFGTVERREADEVLVRALRKALRSGGTLLIATPNQSRRAKGTFPVGHTPQDFRELLSGHFDRVNIKAQYPDPRFPPTAPWDETELSKPNRLRRKLQEPLPYVLKDRFSRLTHNRGFHRGEFDFVLGDDFARSRVLIGYCETR